MALLVQGAPSGAKGIDTITPFSPKLAASFKQAGYSFIVRYLGALDVRERDAILGAGLGLLAVGYSRRAGWEPSAAIGDADGRAAVQHASKAELMTGMSITATWKDQPVLRLRRTASATSTRGPGR